MLFVFKMGVSPPVCVLERMLQGRGGTDDREEKGQLQECGSQDPGHTGEGWVEIGAQERWAQTLHPEERQSR